MRKRLFTIAAAATAATALTLTGCSADAEPTAATTTEPAGLSHPIAKDVSIPGSATFEAITKADKVRIGVKEDQPGLGFLDAATGQRSGFDIEIARWAAASLGFGEDKIDFKAIPSANREAAIVNGDIDYYVGTYSITDARKEQIGFAGPYFVTGQGLLVAAKNTSITSEKDLTGKTVCSATGSTPIQNIKANFPGVKTIEFETYSQCVTALLDGKADAVTTDQAILMGYASQRPDELKVVGEPFTTEKYGIGVSKSDSAFRHFLNKMLTDGGKEWTAIYKATLGKSGTTVTQPAVDDYH